MDILSKQFQLSPMIERKFIILESIPHIAGKKEIKKAFEMILHDLAEGGYIEFRVHPTGLKIVKGINFDKLSDTLKVHLYQQIWVLD